MKAAYVQDYKEAVRYYRMAAEQGDADSQYFLGRIYQEGQGVDQDYEEALRWFRMAAEQRIAQRFTVSVLCITKAKESQSHHRMLCCGFVICRNRSRSSAVQIRVDVPKRCWIVKNDQSYVVERQVPTVLRMHRLK